VFRKILTRSECSLGTVATSIPPLVAFAVVNGFCAGGMFSLIPGVVSSLFGYVSPILCTPGLSFLLIQFPFDSSSTRLTVVFTLLLTFWSPAYFFGAPLAGMLLQASGGPEGGIKAFRPAIFYAAALSTLACSLVAVPKVLEIRKRRKELRQAQ